jgi:hypothetical protein
MRLMSPSFVIVTTLVVGSSPLALADAPPVTTEPTTTWECSQADGTALYTNKELAGCRPMTLKPLSIVPDLEHMPTIPHTVATGRHYQMPSYRDPYQNGDRQTVPDWARDWRTGIAPGDSVQEEVCTLYSEWLHLTQKTRGGFFYGSDPSYGGDVTGRNQRGPSFSFYDNTRYLTLARVFGTGFVPVGCP